MLAVCEAAGDVFCFYNFLSGRGIQKSEELNGRDPKNEAPDQRGIKIKQYMNQNEKGSQNFQHCMQFLAKMNLDLRIFLLISRVHH